MRRVIPIILSHTPPIWEEWGGLSIQVHPLLVRKFFIDKLSTLTAAIPKASVLPTKCVPLSERNSATFPRMATHLLKALIKVGDDISSTSSICTARHVRHVNKIPRTFTVH